MSMYIRIRGRIHGPLSEAQIMQMIQQGKAGKHDYVSTDKKTWQRVTEFPELFPQRVARRDDDELSLADENTSGSASSRQEKGDELWYLSNDGITGTGPFSVGEIQSMLTSGKATRDSFVWREGEGAKPIREVSRFRDSTPVDNEPIPIKGSGYEGDKKQCHSCNRGILHDAAFCPHCGTAQKRDQLSFQGSSPLAGRITCRSCRFILEPGATFCPKCGAEQEAPPAKSRVVYILLAVIILGGFGAHNFYAQRKSAAARQLVLGLSLIGFFVSLTWAVIDAIGVREDGAGVPFLD